MSSTASGKLNHMTAPSRSGTSDHIITNEKRKQQLGNKKEKTLPADDNMNLDYTVVDNISYTTNAIIAVRFLLFANLKSTVQKLNCEVF